MLKVYLDASTKGNPGPSGGGLLIVGEDLHEQHAFVLPTLTNHQAEFAAMHHALEFLFNERMARPDDHAFYTDSKSRRSNNRQKLYEQPRFSEVFRGNPRVAALFHFTDCPMDSRISKQRCRPSGPSRVS